MKGQLRIIILGSLFLTLSPVMAAVNDTTSPATSNPGLWICTTNASSATSGSPDEQADKAMATNATDGNSAFGMAIKNCRDCTKITCEQQTKTAQ